MTSPRSPSVSVTEMDLEPRRGLKKKISLSLFFIAFQNKTQLLNIIIPIIDFKLELHPEMLNDKYSYYQNKHSVKLIASICLMSVCTHTRGGTHVRRGGEISDANLEREVLT